MPLFLSIQLIHRLFPITNHRHSAPYNSSWARCITFAMQTTPCVHILPSIQSLACKCRLMVKLSCAVQLARLSKPSRGHAKNDKLESDHRVDQQLVFARASFISCGVGSKWHHNTAYRLSYATVFVRCQVKMGTPKMGTPGPHFHMKLGSPIS